MELNATLNEWLEGLYRKAGYLTPEMVRDEARDPSSPGHTSIFSMSIEDAAESFYLERAHRTISNAKKYVVGADGKTYFERSYHAIPGTDKGVTSYTYYSVEDVQSDKDKIRAAIKEAGKRLDAAERALNFLISISSGQESKRATSAAKGIARAQQALHSIQQ